MRVVCLIVTSVVLLLSTGRALAGTKEDCMEAHTRGQVEREKGLLSRARHTLVACAQPACPSIVQSDCSRMSEELSHAIPTVTFVARDASGGDLAGTSVFVDDVLVATRLDDGKSYEIDPGKHVIRFVHEIGETTLRVVLNQGEKGRVLVATFTQAPSAPPPPPKSSASTERGEASRSLLPLGVAGVGAAALVAGVIVSGIGLAGVPSSCSVSTNECATPANDPALAEAKSSVSLANTGLGIGITGAVVLAGGIVWYFVQRSHPTASRRGQLALPYALSF